MLEYFALPPEIGLSSLLWLSALAGVAGCLDTIAGGGGLLTLPGLMIAGLDPVQALATNKLQGSFGTFSASWHFARRGEVRPVEMWPAILCTFIGAAAGTLMVQRLSSDFLLRLVPWLLLAFTAYFLVSPRVGDLDSHQRLQDRSFALWLGTPIGFYDGFFGPGTGTFFACAYVALLGYNLRRATVHTKVLNFTSNIAALVFFILGGQVVWLLGLSMGLGQSLGARLGSHLVLRQGTRLIRPLLALVSLTITLRLLLHGGLR